jgi:hypothetical protein
MIFVRVVPGLGLFEARELDDDHAARVWGALDQLGLSATRKILAAVLLDNAPDHAPVLFHAGRIGHVGDLGDEVGGHLCLHEVKSQSRLDDYRSRVRPLGL